MGLKDQIKDDLNFIFDTDELAVLGLWTPDGKPSVSVPGVFSSASKAGTNSKTGSTESVSHEFLFYCKAADVEGIRRNDAIAVDGKNYLVVIKPLSEFGITKIMLNRNY